jgi:hypothetical protein
MTIPTSIVDNFVRKGVEKVHTCNRASNTQNLNCNRVLDQNINEEIVIRHCSIIRW